MPNVDRRRHERYEHSAGLRVRPHGKLRWTEAQMNDVSISGLAFQSSMQLGIGDSVRIVVPAAQGEERITATVRHVVAAGTEYKIGVERQAAAA